MLELREGSPDAGYLVKEGCLEEEALERNLCLWREAAANGSWLSFFR